MRMFSPLSTNSTPHSLQPTLISPLSLKQLFGKLILQRKLRDFQRGISDTSSVATLLSTL